MKKRLRNLKLIGDHIVEHINESKADAELLFEMHRHIDEIEEQITFFHNSVSVFVCCR